MPTDSSSDVCELKHLKSSGRCQALNLCSLGSLFVTVSRKSILPTNVVTFNFFFFRIFQDAH